MTIQGNFDVGDRPRTIYSVTLEESPVDPPHIALVVKSPSGETSSFYNESGQAYTITRDSEGVYRADIPLLVKGLWSIRWVSFDEDGVPLDAREMEIKAITSKTAQPLPALP